MDKFLVNLGGLLGGYALVLTPLDGTFLSGLETALDLIGAVAMIGFSGVFLYRGVMSLLGK